MIILIHDGYELVLTEEEFAVLLGYKKVLDTSNNRGDCVPDITRSVIGFTSTVCYFKTSGQCWRRAMLNTLATSELRVSYPLSREPRHLLWHSVNKYKVNSINIRITDGCNNILDLNSLDVSLSIVIKGDDFLV